MKKDKILPSILILTIISFSFILFQQIDALKNQPNQSSPITITNTQTNTKEGSLTISSSSALLLTGQATLPSTITLPNSTTVSLSSIGYLKFPNGDLFLIPSDNFVQFTNGTITKLPQSMNNLPAGTVYVQKPTWMDNLPSGATLVPPPTVSGAKGATGIS